MKVFKYPLNINKPIVEVPVGSKFLSVQAQKDSLMAWFLVDELQKNYTTVLFSIVGTGHDVPNDIGDFVSTVQMFEGSLMFHIFKSVNAEKE